MSKYNNAKRAAKVGRYSETFSALYNKVVESMKISNLTGKQIAGIVDLMYLQKEYGETAMYNELNK